METRPIDTRYMDYCGMDADEFSRKVKAGDPAATVIFAADCIFNSLRDIVRNTSSVESEVSRVVAAVDELKDRIDKLS